jgi:hypothetical protein
MAAEIVTALEEDMPEVFSLIGVGQYARHSHTVAELVRSYGQLKESDCFRLLFKTMTHKEFSDAVIAGLQSRILLRTQHGTEYVLAYNFSESEVKTNGTGKNP